jgi:uncharacterized membrane protein YfcA
MGIGGGAVLIPALTLFAGSKQHIAQCTNLISFVPVAIIALIIHNKKNNLETGYSFALVLSGLVGSLIGSGLAVKLSAEILSKLFGAFLFIMGGIEILYKDPK